jgi:hypothetical protein
MNSSDIIAIVAIVISAIVSVVSSVITYKNNKVNIEARRSEMAFEKQLEAFRELAERMGHIRLTNLSILANTKNQNASETYFDSMQLAFDQFFLDLPKRESLSSCRLRYCL